jgi:ABC-2 type transport system ATP-binding protein
MPLPAILLDSVDRDYPCLWGLRRRAALTGISAKVAPGTIFGLLGPNGSGKSTLLRLLAGAERPTRGEIQLFGAPLDSATRGRIGYLPEDSPFPAELSAQAALELLGSLQGMGRGEIRRQGAELLERVGLSAEARTPLSRFSRGMARRFGLAQALLHSPDLLLLDEPSAGLDAPGFLVLGELLDEARALGTTVVLSSHDKDELLLNCDELLLLLDGRVAARGSSAAVLGRPGATQLEIADLDQVRLQELESWVTERGGRVVQSAPASRSLVELYRSEAPGARRP